MSSELYNEPSASCTSVRTVGQVSVSVAALNASGAFGARGPQGEGIGDQGHGRAVPCPACSVDPVRGDPDNGWDGGAVPSGIDAGRSIEPDAERIGRECFAIVDHG